MGHVTPVEGSPGGRTRVAATASAGVSAGVDTLHDERSDRRYSSSGVSSITEGSPDCVAETGLGARDAPAGGSQGNFKALKAVFFVGERSVVPNVALNEDRQYESGLPFISAGAAAAI